MTNFINSQMGIVNLLKRSLFILIVITSFCCKQKREKGYVYYEHWMISSNYNVRPLVGEPREVKETYYNNLDDTTLEVPDVSSDYELYRFDDLGNKIFTRFSFLNKGFDMNYTYGPEGPGQQLSGQDSPASPDMKNESRLTSERIGNNKFKISHFREGAFENYVITTFSPDRQTLTEENWINDILTGSATRYYRNDRLMREETRKEKKRRESKYYYSDKGFLDSILVFDNGQPSGSTIYMNNDHGDAVLYTRYGKDGIEAKRRMQYQYDEKGNWIKQLTWAEIDNSKSPRYGPGEKFPQYSMVIREIKY